MITLSYYQLLLAFLILVFLYFSYRQIKHIMLFFKIRNFTKKILKEKEDSVAKMKEEGRMHKWVTLPVRIPGKGVVETQVCEETGYCPSIDGFVDKLQLLQMTSQKRIDEEFKAFKKQRIKDISWEYGIKEDIFEDLVTAIYSIKKDFHVKKMEESIKEMKEQFGNNVEFVSSIEDLEKILKEKKDEPVQ